MNTHNPHDHRLTESCDSIPGYYEIMETAVPELLVEKKLVGPGEIRRQIEVLDSRTPALGAKVVARAWVDAEFKARLLANGRAACEEFGISFYDDTQLIVLENTDTVHNRIVCTLCSCYPRRVLGLPPDWYKLKPHRARAVKEPRALLAESAPLFRRRCAMDGCRFYFSAQKKDPQIRKEEQLNGSALC